ncbi:hypothetical protein [Lactococcus lactis]|nr:hypothetical protein [Lactococcus lactis]
MNQSLNAILSVNGLEKKVVYSNVADAFEKLSLTNANRIQIQN